MSNDKLAEALRDAEATVLAFLGDVAVDGSVCGIKQAIVKGMFARLQAHVAEAAQDAEDAKDAARYRWLRDSADSYTWDYLGGIGAGRVDAAIDAAMAKESGK